MGLWNKYDYNQTTKIIGVPKNDFFNQYLAYHEGHRGWHNKTFKTKEWLQEAAKKVELNAIKYKEQLKLCENKLNKKGLFGIF